MRYETQSHILRQLVRAPSPCTLWLNEIEAFGPRLLGEVSESVVTCNLP